MPPDRAFSRVKSKRGGGERVYGRLWCVLRTCESVYSSTCQAQCDSARTYLAAIVGRGEAEQGRINWQTTKQSNSNEYASLTSLTASVTITRWGDEAGDLTAISERKILQLTDKFGFDGRPISAISSDQLLWEAGWCGSTEWTIYYWYAGKQQSRWRRGPITMKIDIYFIHFNP